MTADEVDAAAKAEGLAWEILSGGLVDATALFVPAFSKFCNVTGCQSYAEAANAKGKTVDQLVAILRLHVGDPKTDPPKPGDSTQLRALLSA